MEVGVKFLEILRAEFQPARKRSGSILGVSLVGIPNPFDNNICAVLAFETSMVYIEFKVSRLHPRASRLIPYKHECIHVAQLHIA